MRRHARRLAWLFVCTALAAHAEQIDVTIDTAGGPRHAIVVPSGSGPRPTVLVLHGATGTAGGTMRSTGFAEATASRGFTAVYPDGLDRRWNDGRAGGNGGPDDVAFLKALVARLVADRISQPAKVFIAGISNGGMMSFTMMCKSSALFAGVGTIIANMPTGIDPCVLKPVPIVMINGTADPMVPYRGGGVGFRGERGTVDSVDRTIARFVKIDGCIDAPVSRPIPSKTTGATSVVRVDWTGCSTGPVTLYRVDGGGHAIPGRPSLFGGLLGPSNQDFGAADAILEAFAVR